MVVADLDIVRTVGGPGEGEAPLVVDPNTVLPRTAVSQTLEPIPRRLRHRSVGRREGAPAGTVRAMAVDVSDARLGDRDSIAGLLDDYLQELAQQREVAVGATDSRSYPYLDAYFSESGRRPFLIRREGKLAGFALIRDPTSTGRFWEVAEFFITPTSRRKGVGRDAIELIWRRFPGSWELQVHARNTASLRFWTSCIEASAKGAPQLTEIETEDGKRFQLDFRVERTR